MWKKKKNNRRWMFIKHLLSSVLILVLIGVMVASNLAIGQFGRMIQSGLGTGEKIVTPKELSQGLDLAYTTSDYTKEEMKTVEKELNEEISGEGIVLLKNDDGSFPYKKSTEFSFFGQAADKFITGGLFGGGKMTLKTAFEEQGFKVNESLWNFYTKGKGSDYGLGPGSISFGDDEDFSINEAPLSVLEAEKGLLASAQKTTAVFVIQRMNGEGRDLPRSMYNHTDVAEDQVKSYLEPTSEELAVIDYLNEHFSDVVLIANTSAALELGWVEEYENIKTVLYTPALGKHGLNALARIFAGEINPSGHVVDQFAYNAFSSPAAVNYGDFQYYTEDGKPTIYNYVSYKEGIYVGYKYYETRYEDIVLDQGNPGDFDYQKEVQYPFGYGLSFSEFEWSNYETTWVGQTCSVTVDVKNVSQIPGKEVVQVYAQSPYTDYDKAYQVEKAAVNLVAYGKTALLEPGASETLTLTFEQEQLKSYDYVKAKTYILDAGEYFITAATNAHDATNNILAQKGKTVADGMTADGNKQLVALYKPDNQDVNTTSYQKDLLTGVTITNQFDEAHGGLQYLSRQDWSGTWPTVDGEVSNQISTWGNEINGQDKAGKPASYLYTKTLSQAELAKLEAVDSLNPLDDKELETVITYGKDNGLSLIELRGLAYDDPLWETLLDQLTPEDYHNLINFSGYGTLGLDSVEKPYAIDMDAVTGFFMGGTGMAYQSVMVLAQTWNVELAEEYGEMIGNEAHIGGATGWYAPAMNSHRTPFSGRNGEYYSEDAFLSGDMAAASVKGVAAKGVYSFLKHFALNDQENHRGDRDGQLGVATWSNEQAIRELYLAPFERVMKAGNVMLNYGKKDKNGQFVNATTDIPAAQGIMTAFNRLGSIWTGGHYNLLTGVLREEWGFNGFIVTDNANTGKFMDGGQMIRAGGDGKLTIEDGNVYDFDKDNQADYYYGRQAAHHILYTVANSKAMNGAMPGSTIKKGLAPHQLIRIGINTVCSLLILLLVYAMSRRVRQAKRNNKMTTDA